MHDSCSRVGCTEGMHDMTSKSAWPLGLRKWQVPPGVCVCVSFLAGEKVQHTSLSGQATGCDDVICALGLHCSQGSHTKHKALPFLGCVKTVLSFVSTWVATGADAGSCTPHC
jgi:hypothetical protein